MRLRLIVVAGTPVFVISSRGRRFVTVCDDYVLLSARETDEENERVARMAMLQPSQLGKRRP